MYNLTIGKDFIDRTEKATTTKGKKKKLEFIKTTTHQRYY